MTGQLAAMRVDYRTDGFDVDDLAPTWHEQLARWLAEAGRRGRAGAERDGAGHRGPGRPPVVPHRAVQGPRRARRRVLHQLHLGQEPRPAHHPLRLGDLPLVRPAPAGARARHGRAGDPRARPRPTGPAGRAAPSSARGRRRSRWSCGTAGSSTTRWPRSTRRFAVDDQVPLPPHWGGWRIGPEQVEFWQGRTDRMHDRLRFEVDDWTARGRCAGWRPEARVTAGPRRPTATGGPW